MQLGLVGLGKMGFNMRERLREGGHEVIGYDPRPEVTDVPTLAALAEALDAPRVVWVMVPSGSITDETITSLAEVRADGDLVVDGGNSRYTVSSAVSSSRATSSPVSIPARSHATASTSMGVFPAPAPRPRQQPST